MESKIYIIALLAVREDGTFELSSLILTSAGSIDEVTEEARLFAIEKYPEGGEWAFCHADISQGLSITDVMQMVVDEERRRRAEGEARDD